MMFTTSLRRRRLRAILKAGCLVAGAWAFCAPAGADDWPARPVTVVVPFPAGGGTDAFARPLLAAMTRATGKQFLIDNKGGGGGTVGAAAAAAGPADGQHFFMGAVHHAIAPWMYPRLAYDLERDFVPIALVASVPQVIVINASKVPVKDLAGFREYVRRNPGKLNFGSAGNGTSHHLAGELFKGLTNSYIVHIPYRGSGPALQDLIAGQVEVMFDGLGSSAAHINGGRIKALAVASEKRAPGFPDVPTASEAGLADYRVSTWYGIWAPRGTPKEAIDGMHRELKKAFESPELQAVWRGLGTEAPNLYGDAFAAFVADETSRWGRVVKRSGAKLD